MRAIWLLLLATTLAHAGAPTGTKMAKGRHFEIYVSKDSEKPGPADTKLYVFAVLAVAETKHHGIQQLKLRIETINADLLNPTSWQVIDFDEDHWDDFRYVSGITSAGCRTWEAKRWDAEHERFTSAPKYARHTNADGSERTGFCPVK